MRKMRSGNYCGLFVMNKRQKIIGGCQMRFVVFLDIDGVLNTRTTVKRTPYGYTGIDDARVKVLANAIEKCGGGDIVLHLIGKCWIEIMTITDILYQNSSSVD